MKQSDPFPPEAPTPGGDRGKAPSRRSDARTLPTETILQRAAASGGCSFDEAVALLSLDPDSPDAAHLRHVAHQAALAWTGGQASVWFAIGLDSAPCPKSCSFCSFGQKWGLVKEPWRLGMEQALATVRAHDVPGVGYIVLRTTDLFPLEELMDLARRATPLTHARLVANVGDFGDETACSLREAGFHMIYHALRLREGLDTGLAPATRMRTMRAARDCSLELAALADPIGPEHEAEEIARSLFTHKQAGATVMGAMARIPVPGTPKFALAGIGPARHAQVTAVARLVAGPGVSSICAHPPDAAVVSAGANVVVVESGAIPRDTERARADWRSFSIKDAVAMLGRAGYRMEEAARAQR
uniref:Biotin synthase-like enzyme n=1 Tax=Desulfovibrio sp. U5L TaxID=596152 RepID=I2Q6U9_9BACT